MRNYVLDNEELSRRIDNVRMAVDPSPVPIDAPAISSPVIHSVDSGDGNDRGMNIDANMFATSYSLTPSTTAPAPVATDRHSIMQPQSPSPDSEHGSPIVADQNLELVRGKVHGDVEKEMKNKDVDTTAAPRCSSRQPLKGIYPGEGISIIDPIDLTARRSRCVKGKIVEIIDLTKDAVCPLCNIKNFIDD